MVKHEFFELQGFFVFCFAVAIWEEARGRTGAAPMLKGWGWGGRRCGRLGVWWDTAWVFVFGRSGWRFGSAG